jgi:hypothetical protein
MPDHVDRTVTMDYQLQGGYSLFNHSSKEITLRIPPTLPQMATGKLRKEKPGSSWSIKFIAEQETGGGLPAVYVGYAAGMKKSLYPLTHSFSPLKAWVFDRSTGERYGHHIGEDASGGLASEVQISNSGETARTLRFRLEETGALPQGYEGFCYDAATQTIDTSGEITVDPESIVSRWIVAGDAAYREKFLLNATSLKFMLHSLYPNPARSRVNIRFTVPFGSQERIRISICNIMGRKVWEKRIDELLTEGVHLVAWDGRNLRGSPVGSGMYIIRFLAIDARGKTVKQFDRRVSLLK